MQWIFLLCLIALSSAQGFGCTAWKDTYLYFTNTSDDTLTIDYYGAKRSGYFGLGFYSEMNQSMPSLYVMTLVGGDTRRLQSHRSNIILPLNHTVDQSTHLIIDDQFHVSISIPYSMISMARYIGFARSFSKINNVSNFDQLFPMHEEYDFKVSPIWQPNVSLSIGYCEPTFLRHTGRILSDFDFLFYPTMVGYICFFLAAVYFRDREPLRSRGFGPLLAPLGFCGNLLFGYITELYWNFEEQYDFSCFTTVFGEYLCTLGAVVVPFINMMRYIALINVNYHKQRLILKSNAKNNGRDGDESSHSSNEFPWYVLVLNKLTNPYILILVDIIVVFCFAVLGAVVFSIYDWKCGTFASTIMRYATVVIIVILVGCTGLAIAYDLWNNRKILVKCGWKKYLIDHDHFFYRIEMLPAIFAGIAALLWILAPFPSIIKIIFCEAIYVVAIWVSGGCTLAITIFLWLKELCSRNSNEKENESVLDPVFDDPELFNMFLEFSKDEFSTENLYMKKSIKDFKRRNSIDQKDQMAAQIMSKFLTPNSPFEVNLPGSVLSAVKDAFEKESISLDVFDKCETEVTANLLDTFHRFRWSKKYIAHQRKLEALGVQGSVLTSPRKMKNRLESF